MGYNDLLSENRYICLGSAPERDPARRQSSLGGIAEAPVSCMDPVVVGMVNRIDEPPLTGLAGHQCVISD